MPLDEIDAEERIGGGYRYTLGPLLLLMMEERLGDETVQGALASLVTDPPEGPTDYGTFRDRLERAGASVDALESFEDTCLVPRPWESCLVGFDPDRRGP